MYLKYLPLRFYPLCSFQFFTRLAAVFAEEVGGFGLLLLLNWKWLKRHWWSYTFYSTHIKQSKIYPPPTLGCS